MKATLVVAVGLLAMGVAPALAEDGHVSQATLSAIGLGGMQVVSDADGMQVRGLSGWSHRGSGYISGRSIVVGQVVDPKTDSFFLATDTNGYYFSPGRDAPSRRGSIAAGSLKIEHGFEGSFLGAAGSKDLFTLFQ